MVPIRPIALALSVLSLTACMSEARIAMPSDVAAATDMVELSGMGGGERGTFELAGDQGRFQRSADRVENFGVVERMGGGSFTLAGLSGRCGFDARDVNLGSGSQVNADKLIYTCEFERVGQPVDALLWVEASDGKGLSAFRYERRGKLFFKGQEIDVRSLHSLEGSRMPTLTPIGYAFDVDGGQIGAVDLNGLGKTLYLPRDAQRREAVLAASLALSVFWDPGDSD